MTEADYCNRIAAFAEQLRPDAERLDGNDGLLAAWFDRFVLEGLSAGCGARQPLSGAGFHHTLASLAEVSGAFAFTALQQFVGNMTAGDRGDGDLWPRIGVAFGHIGKPGRRPPFWDGRYVNGVLPWLSGAGIFDQVVLGVIDAEGREVYALADARNRPEFLHSAPMALVACAGTRTVSVQIRDLPLKPEAVLRSDPQGTRARSDAEGVLYQTPLMVGCIRACRGIIRASSLLGGAEKEKCEQKTEALLARVEAAFEHSTPEEGMALRAEIGDFAVRIARLAAMASGGAALLQAHAAQRLYREALVFNLMAQTGAIVNRAFQDVFL